MKPVRRAKGRGPDGNVEEKIEDTVRPDESGGGDVRRAAQRVPSTYVETKRRAKRMRILESAVRSFAKRGFFGTSMEDIADDLL
ncbi:MAG: hypothetical protein ABIT01_13695, partial [Thermoanaerobaculia bacterium]